MTNDVTRIAYLNKFSSASRTIVDDAYLRSDNLYQLAETLDRAEQQIQYIAPQHAEALHSLVKELWRQASMYAREPVVVLFEEKAAQSEKMLACLS